MAENRPRSWGVFLVRMHHGFSGYGTHDEESYLGGGARSTLPGLTRKAVAKNLKLSRRKLYFRVVAKGRVWELPDYPGPGTGFLYVIGEL